MTPQELDAWLVQSCEDRLLSRRERQAFRDLIEPLEPEPLKQLRQRAFQIARETFSKTNDGAVLNWLEEVLNTLETSSRNLKSIPPAPLAEAYFSPGEACPRAIERLLESAEKTADICVFTITDDRLAEAILQAHRRKIKLRIITDNAKAEDLGSDVDRLEHAGIALKVDESPFHMHHKFAIVDGRTLLTGSYNWTRGAARDNEENLIITNEVRLVGPFQETFERLWKTLA